MAKLIKSQVNYSTILWGCAQNSAKRETKIFLRTEYSVDYYLRYYWIYFSIKTFSLFLVFELNWKTVESLDCEKWLFIRTTSQNHFFYSVLKIKFFVQTISVSIDCLFHSFSSSLISRSLYNSGKTEHRIIVGDLRCASHKHLKPVLQAIPAELLFPFP